MITVKAIQPFKRRGQIVNTGECFEIPADLLSKLDGYVMKLSPVPVKTLPEWQESLCEAHGDFNRWRGQCPLDLDDCLLTRIIEASTLDDLRGLEIGKGINTDTVIEAWTSSGEPAAALLTKPTWLIVMAEYLSKGGDHGCSTTA